LLAKAMTGGFSLERRQSNQFANWRDLNPGPQRPILNFDPRGKL
jgi:hypothetical protein